MVYRYGLVMSGGQFVAPEQVERLIATAIASCEKFYPALQLVSWGGRSVDDAMQIAMNEAYGRA